MISSEYTQTGMPTCKRTTRKGFQMYVVGGWRVALVSWTD